MNFEQILSMNKNIRDRYGGIHKYRKGYQHATDLVNNENRDLLPDSKSILNVRNNYFCQPLNVS
jgi:hypothetical protein